MSQLVKLVILLGKALEGQLSFGIRVWLNNILSTTSRALSVTQIKKIRYHLKIMQEDTLCELYIIKTIIIKQKNKN